MNARAASYAAIGRLVARMPSLVSSELSLVGELFSQLGIESNGDIRSAIEHALFGMTAALRDLTLPKGTLSSGELSENCLSVRDYIESLLLKIISHQLEEKSSLQSQRIAVHYAKELFESDHVPSKYILLLLSGSKYDFIYVKLSLSKSKLCNIIISLSTDNAHCVDGNK